MNTGLVKSSDIIFFKPRRNAIFKLRPTLPIELLQQFLCSFSRENLADIPAFVLRGPDKLLTTCWAYLAYDCENIGPSIRISECKETLGLHFRV